jgi:galactokinase
MNKSLITLIYNTFVKTFNTKPILVSAPGRINIIGEHTDYNDGFVLPAAIDKGIFAAIGISERDVCSVIALDVEESFQFTLQNINPIKSGGWQNYVLGVVVEIQKKGGVLSPFNIVFGGDIPHGAGLSSSAALENSIVFGLNEIYDLKLTKNEMILISQQAEHNYVGVKCGIMDQYASMFGIKDGALLIDCKTITSEAIKIDFKEYQIVLVNTNVKHSLVDAAYNERRNVCEKVASLLNVTALREATEESLNAVKHLLKQNEFQKALYVIQENERVLKAAQMIKEHRLDELGKLLFEAHNGAQHQFEISCDELDYLVDYAKKNEHVIGARMMGGGFGGCTINLVKKTHILEFEEEIKTFYKQQFGIDSSVYFINLANGVQLISNHAKD